MNEKLPFSGHQNTAVNGQNEFSASLLQFPGSQDPSENHSNADLMLKINVLSMLKTISLLKTEIYLRIL